MSIMGVFFVLIASITLIWLVREGVLQSPWLEEGEIAAYSAAPPPAAKVGLAVFLAVAACLFFLLAAAFFMRMGSSDWAAPPAPKILWFSTAALIASSAAVHVAQRAASDAAAHRLRAAVLAALLLSLAFVIGQFLAWREMIASGLLASDNPANAFFYLLTGIHALHVLGGFAALGMTAAKAWLDDAAPLAASVGLCAIYWRFLLFVWLVLFALLAGWGNGVAAICRRALA